MPLHPQARAMIETFAAGSTFDYAALTGAEFRAAFDVPSPAATGSHIAKVENHIIEGADGPLRVRLYHPGGEGPFPITVFIHGGGFVIGSPETTEGICRTLAAEAGSVIVSPDYRLAPEAPFPAGINDAWTALLWAHEHADEFRGVASKMAVAGDSSGGNFAAVLAQMAHERGLLLRHQLLLYPVMDHSFETRSYIECASGYFLTAEMMRWFWRQYLVDEKAAGDWRASPLRRADLQGLAPATIITAEFDVLRDEAEAYATKLAEAGVPVSLRRWPGQIHGFLLQQGVMDDADIALAEAAKVLRTSFL
jgi:acetyl esterase/lipase